MFAEPHEEPQKPKLKLEVIRGGGGGGAKTAIGLRDFHNEPEPPMEWQDIPDWFAVSLPVTTKFVRKFCMSLPIEQRNYLFRQAGVTRRYRVLISSRWKFGTDEDFTRDDALEICDKVELDTKAFVTFSDLTEAQAVWRVWSFCSQQTKYPWQFKDALLEHMRDNL